jgi:ATP-binding cassette, subfamily F, member 3
VMKLLGVQSVVGSRTLFAPFSAEVLREERIAIVGPNGCGKSTLMRAMAGAAPPTHGSIIPGAGVRLAYYRQDFTHLDPARKVREEVSLAAPKLTTTELRSHLGRFLFSGDDQEALIGGLSGGEQARVALAKITLEKANLLLLDEPTNHLDLESREALEESLEEFDGTVVFISHDRAFLSALATRVWAWVDGRFEDYPGGFDDWQDWAARRKEAAVAASAPVRQAEVDRARTAAKPASISKNELRRRQTELDQLEARIHEIEARTAEIEAALADPALYASGADVAAPRALTAEREALATELAQAYDTWARLGEELSGV